MSEMALGLLVLVASAAAVVGLGQGWLSVQLMMPMPMLLTAATATGIFGVLLTGHGLYRLRLKRAPDARHWTRSGGLMWTVLATIAVLAFVLPLLAPFFNIVKIAGFPLGFYMAAQGSLILLVALTFAYAARADKIDEQEDARED